MLEPGETRFLANVLVPPGTYTLSAAFTVAATDDHSSASCYFQSTGDLHGAGALIQLDTSADNARGSLVGDVTTTASKTFVILACTGNNNVTQAVGQMIATQVTSVVPTP